MLRGKKMKKAEIYDSAFDSKTFKSGKSAIEPNNLYKLCFILLPLSDKSKLEPLPQNKMLVPFNGFLTGALTSNNKCNKCMC